MKRRADAKGAFVIGRAAFAKISEVEGIKLSDEARVMFAEFDRLKLSHEERRRIIIARFKSKVRD